MTPNQKNRYRSPRRARGWTLTGFLCVMLAIICIGVPALKVLPTLIEYRAITSSIESIKAAGGSREVMRTAFDRHSIGNEITSLHGQDLQIDNGSQGELELSFAYSKKISVYGPVSLLLDYRGSTAQP